MASVGGLASTSTSTSTGCPVVFVDTHTLLAADDAFDAVRQNLARAWLQVLWLRRAGRVSTQTLNDYYVFVTRNFAMPAGDARAKLRRFQLWKPWQVDHQTVETAWGVEARFGLRYWDALMVASAAQSGATHVLTPNLTHQQHIDGVIILNPFLISPVEMGMSE